MQASLNQVSFHHYTVFHWVSFSHIPLLTTSQAITCVEHSNTLWNVACVPSPILNRDKTCPLIWMTRFSLHTPPIVTAISRDGCNLKKMKLTWLSVYHGQSQIEATVHVDRWAPVWSMRTGLALKPKWHLGRSISKVPQRLHGPCWG